jgi:hypothetical protein
MGPLVLLRYLADGFTWAQNCSPGMLSMIFNGYTVVTKEFCQAFHMGSESGKKNIANNIEWVYHCCWDICRWLHMGPEFLRNITADDIEWAHF